MLTVSLTRQYMYANIEVAVGIGSRHFVQLFVLVAAIFKLGTRATSGNADSAISKSRITHKVAIEVGIAPAALNAQTLFSFLVWLPPS